MSSTLNSQQFASINQALTLLKSLAHQGRLQVLCALGQKEMNASQLAELTSLSPSALTQHLKPMEAEGLIQCRKQGTFRYYKLTSPEASAIIKVLKRYYCKP